MVTVDRGMTEAYKYSLAECDVADKQSLQSSRDKRSIWLAWIDGDEHHAIWKVLAEMVWTDVSFQTLASLAVGCDANALNDTLLAEALLTLLSASAHSSLLPFS